jgi:hypothetical protein
MTAGKATGKDRDYQVFCRDLLLKQYGSKGLHPCEGDGIDVPFDVGVKTTIIWAGREVWKYF